MIRSLKSRLARPAPWAFAAVAAAALAVMLGTCIRVWQPGYGLTRFIPIGSVFTRRGIAAYRDAPKYSDPSSKWGFDGQLYAELSLDPLLRDPGLRTALDDPPYRAHRILLSWLAWAGGLGRPAWVLTVFAALNPIFWLGYLAILYALFRKLGWAGVAGFGAMLLTCGVVESTYRTLTDFPAFVLMTLAAMLGGMGGAAAMALAGLTREVNVIGIAGLFEGKPGGGRALGRNALMALVALGPLLVWSGYVAWRLGISRPSAGGNLDWPFRAMVLRLAECLRSFRREGLDWADFFREPTEAHALLTIIATFTQCLYVATHPRRESRLWRIGALIIPYFHCVSSNVWGGVGYFTVTRHALPITLAFNLLLAMRPRRTWLVWFVLGNCFVPAGICEFVRFGEVVPKRPDYVVLAQPPLDGELSLRYASGWSGPEWDAHKAWRWATSRTAVAVLSNGSGKPLEVSLDFRCMSLRSRDLRITAGKATIWEGDLYPKPQSVAVHTLAFLLPPGGTAVSFSSPQAPTPPSANDPRPLALMVADLRISAQPGR